MATHLTPALRADVSYSVPIPSDRFARRNERSQSATPLMRKFEIARLLPDGSSRTSHHLAPATPVFEATSAAFAHGTLITTPDGPIAVEDLIPGDLINVQDGPAKPVLWIGSTTYVPAQTTAATALTHLSRVLPDAFGSSIHAGDLLLGPAARLIQSRSSLQSVLGIRAILTPIRDLEDGYSVLRITPPSPVRLYHIMLEQHSIIFAGGRPVESYHPDAGTRNMLGTSSQALFLSFFPQLTSFDDFGELRTPRMSQDMLDRLLYGS